MTAFLTARNQCIRDQINYANEYVTATPAVRAAAMLQWRQQNTAQIRGTRSRSERRVKRQFRICKAPSESRLQRTFCFAQRKYLSSLDEIITKEKSFFVDPTCILVAASADQPRCMNIRTRILECAATMFSIGTFALYGQVVSSNPASRVTPSSVVISSNASERNATILAYQEEQHALLVEYRALVTSGASAEQIQLWVKNNASRFHAQAQRAQTLTSAFRNSNTTVGDTTRLPADANATALNFARNEAALDRSIASSTMRNSAQASVQANTLNTPGAVPVVAQAATFVQQNAALLNQQRQIAATLAASSLHLQVAVPSTIAIPVGASPQMASVIGTHNLLIQKLSEFQSQYANADVATRESAMAQWRKQNAALILQLQNEANTLSAAAETQSTQLQN